MNSTSSHLIESFTLIGLNLLVMPMISESSCTKGVLTLSTTSTVAVFLCNQCTNDIDTDIILKISMLVYATISIPLLAKKCLKTAFFSPFLTLPSLEPLTALLLQTSVVTGFWHLSLILMIKYAIISTTNRLKSLTKGIALNTSKIFSKKIELQ